MRLMAAPTPVPTMCPSFRPTQARSQEASKPKQRKARSSLWKKASRTRPSAAT